jgi:D-alanyl-D-alanine carboxypeptidase (penicillin-binding protein 5/6)
MKKFIAKTLIILLSLASLNSAAYAKPKKNCNKTTNTQIKRTQTTLVIDADTGKILQNVNSHEKIYPASLTKLMTLYVVFDEIKKNHLSLNDKLNVSLAAESMRPCKLGLRSGETISTKDAILGMIVKSANDASVVLAEAISGTEKSFANKMNETAKKLGMKDSLFFNASGWHHPDQKTSALDLAKLTLAIKRDFPEFYPWFKKDSFEFAGRIIKGHNRVTREYAWAEGMKTGYTIPSGFNLVSTASKDGKKVIAVVTGRPTAAQRDKEMMKILDNHLGNHKERNVFETAKETTKPETKKKIEKPKAKKIDYAYKKISKKKYAVSAKKLKKNYAKNLKSKNQKTKTKTVRI